jgi:dipeptidyl aminopeptidase/acylaminoacyl peptidase
LDLDKAKAAPYGAWKSPITAELIATRTTGTLEPFFGLGEITFDGEDLYWMEMRPAEDGRYVVMRLTPDGRSADVTPSPFNASTRVHEIGGGAFVVNDGTVYFSDFGDQRLYRQDPESKPRPITPESDLRYADGVIDSHSNRMICVREDHTGSGREPVNTLVSLKLESGASGEVLVSGNDFYSAPRLSRDGASLAWVSWDHPNLPFKGTELWVAEVKEDGSLGGRELVAGDGEESIFQPEWSPDGVLHFVSDRTGWWNLYRWQDGRVESLCEMEAEFGYPLWVFRLSLYDFESADRIICAYTRRGIWYLASLDTTTRKLEPIETPYSDIWSVRAASGRAIFAAGSPTEPASIVQLDLATRRFDVLHRSSDITIDEGYLSPPQAIEFPTEHGLTAHAFFYEPQNRGYTASPGELPPLLVTVHQGPTMATWTTLRLDIQYWTSRGIAVLDVNYGGSTGYGREYRDRMMGQWGIVDVDDCVNGARYLVEQGKVDGDRLAIRGGSSGGTCTLCALTFRDIFECGASYYGDSDFELSAKETHKLDSRFIDYLVGPYPEEQELYRARSPIHSVDRLSCPVIFFQGLDDLVVRPNQTELMVDALRAGGVPVAYVPFEGEGHGFRRAENIKRALDAELYFYSRIFGFDLAEPVEPVAIQNL